VVERRWNKVVLVVSVVFLVVATMVWLSGFDMFLGSMLLVVVGGWALVAVCGIVTFARAARGGSERWFQRWTVVWLGCLVALVGSVGIGLAGVPDEARVRLSRGALRNAGERVLAGEEPSRAGLYGFRRTSIEGGCAMMETAIVAIDVVGFAYCPSGGPAAFEDLGGGLYQYHLD
jgi:hypothetical protein